MFSLGFWLGFGWSHKGVRTGPTAAALVVKPSTATTSIATATTSIATATTSIATATASITPATAGRLIALLLDQGVKLAVLQHLAEAADCETQNCNGRAEIESLLQGPCRAYFIVA